MIAWNVHLPQSISVEDERNVGITKTRTASAVAPEPARLAPNRNDVRHVHPKTNPRNLTSFQHHAEAIRSADELWRPVVRVRQHRRVDSNSNTLKLVCRHLAQKQPVKFRLGTADARDRPNEQ